MNLPWLVYRSRAVIEPQVIQTYCTQQPTKETNLKLNQNELEVLLFLISNGNFKGRDIERIYKLAVKLQNEHDKL